VRESVTRGVEDVRRHGQDAVDAASRLASQAVGTINEMTSRRS
jgi:hypothetical protein